MNTGLPLRKHVPDNEKWNLEDLFTNDEAFYNTLNDVLEKSAQFNQKYKNNLSETKIILDALKEYEDLLIQFDRLGNYAELRLSVDTTNELAQTLNAKLSTSYGKISSLLSFVESEIMILSDDKLKELKEQFNSPHYLEKLINLINYLQKLKKCLPVCRLLFKVLMNSMEQLKCLILRLNRLNIIMKCIL